jgi:hypothetical protein
MSNFQFSDYLIVEQESIRIFRRLFIFLSTIVSVLFLGLWCGIFAYHNVTNIDLYWLPAVNILGLMLALYIDRDAKQLLDDADRLESLKYEYKKV